MFESFFGGNQEYKDRIDKEADQENREKESANIAAHGLMVSCAQQSSSHGRALFAEQGAAAEREASVRNVVPQEPRRASPSPAQLSGQSENKQPGLSR